MDELGNHLKLMMDDDHDKTSTAASGFSIKLLMMTGRTDLLAGWISGNRVQMHAMHPMSPEPSDRAEQQEYHPIHALLFLLLLLCHASLSPVQSRIHVTHLLHPLITLPFR